MIFPKKVETAYQALCDLGLSLAATGHQWTNEQREAWERAECALRSLVNPNVKVRGATPIGGASLSTAWLGVLLANVVPLILLQFAQEQTDLFKAAVRSGPFNVLAQAEHF